MKKDFPHKIGGDFEINPNDLEGIADYKPNKNHTLYSSGRSAFMAILEQIKKNKPAIIRIPYYICPSVVAACKNSGFQITFYELDSNFLFPEDKLNELKQDETLLTVNYFEFIDDNELLKDIKNKRPDIVTISDHVQSIWTFRLTEADYSFTSFRKHFATPDGAVVFSKYHKLITPDLRPDNNFFWPKLNGAILKQIKAKDELYLHFLKEGEKKLDDSTIITKASKVGLYIYEHTKIEAIKRKRKTNYKFIYEEGIKHGLNFIFPYSKKVIPMCVPILIENRDAIRENLKKSNIYLPVHWPIEKYNQKSDLASKMARNELSLIIDQRYSRNELKLILKNITN